MKIYQGQIPPYPKIRGKIQSIMYPCYVEDKLDGEANIYHEKTLISKASGKVRTDTPITTYLSGMFDHNTVLFGELYWGEGKKGALYKFLSHAKDDNLRFGVFDAIHPDIENEDYETRREWLTDRLVESVQVHLINTAYCEDPTDKQRLVTLNKIDGYEGVVLKNANSRLMISRRLIVTQNGWVKVKHIDCVDVRVVHIDPTLERMDIEFGGRKVGVKLVNKYKSKLKVGDTIEVEHMGVLNGGGLRHPVYRGKVVYS